MKDTEAVPLWARPWLTIPQTMKLMGKGREWVQARLDAGEILWVQDGCRVKVHAPSLRAWVQKQADEQMQRVGLKKAA